MYASVQNSNKKNSISEYSDSNIPGLSLRQIMKRACEEKLLPSINGGGGKRPALRVSKVQQQLVNK